MALTFKSTGAEQVFAVMKDTHGRIAITTGTQDGNGYEFVTVLPRGEVCRERVPNIEWLEANEHAQRMLARHRAQFILDRERNDQDPVVVQPFTARSIVGGDDLANDAAYDPTNHVSRLKYGKKSVFS